MLKIHNLKPSKGSKPRKKILGRGESSGHGGQSTRGNKGHKARSGYHRVGNFEGGQMPLIRRIPKRGFTHKGRIKFKTINICQISKKFNNGEIVSPETLVEKNLLKSQDYFIKILGEGKIDINVEVHAHAFSEKAKNSIEKAGGRVIVLNKNKK
ncbi:MAG TPA: 50S ribosomal protein L15 [bacterium]|nr:50S ribosomal protein L15 [bacterium]